METFIKIVVLGIIVNRLADNSNKLFKSLKTKRSITETELKFFTIKFKKATNLF